MNLEKDKTRETTKMVIEGYNQGFITLSELTLKIVQLFNDYPMAFDLETVPEENKIA